MDRYIQHALTGIFNAATDLIKTYPPPPPLGREEDVKMFVWVEMK